MTYATQGTNTMNMQTVAGLVLRYGLVLVIV